MTNTRNQDLRDGKPAGDGNTKAKLPGHEDKVMPTAPTSDPVNPGVGSKAGVAEGQVTKSN